MLLTVVIPNYNNEMYIEKCISSVINQSFRDLEILMIDDASTDNSVELIESMVKRDGRIKIIKQERNQGVSAARNRGLYCANGKYITFLDGDDFYWSENKLEKEVQLLKQYEASGMDIIAYSKIIHVDEGATLFRVQPSSKWRSGDLYNYILTTYKTANLPRDYCAKTSIIKEEGAYSENMNLFEDYDLLLRLAKKYRFQCTLNDGTAYRIKMNGLSHCSYKEADKVIWEIFNKYNVHLSPINKSKNYVIKIGKSIVPKLFNEVYERLALNKTNK